MSSVIMLPEKADGCIGFRNPYFTPSDNFLTDRIEWANIDVNGISKLLKISAPTWITDRSTLFPSSIQFAGKSSKK